MGQWPDPTISPQLQERVLELRQQDRPDNVDPGRLRAELEHLAEGDDQVISAAEAELIEATLDLVAPTQSRPPSTFEPTRPLPFGTPAIMGPVKAFISDRAVTTRLDRHLQRAVADGDEEAWQAARQTALRSLQRLKQDTGKALDGLSPEMERVFDWMQRRLQVPRWQQPADATAIAVLESEYLGLLAGLTPGEMEWIGQAAIRVRALADRMALHVDKVGCERVDVPSPLARGKTATSLECTPIGEGNSRRAEAENRARQLAGQDPDHAYTVREFRQSTPGIGESPILEYRIERAPASSFEALAAAARSGGRLVSVYVQRDGDVTAAELERPRSYTYAGGNIFDPQVPLRPDLAGERMYQNEAIEQVGRQAKTLVDARYGEAIAGFQRMHDDRLAMAQGILHLVASAPDDATAARRLANAFGVSNRNPVPPPDTDPDIVAYWASRGTDAEELAAAARQVLAQANRAGSDQERQQLLERFSRTSLVGSAQRGAGRQLELLQEARSELRRSNLREAAYTLLREFPSIRAEVYRRCGFEHLASSTRSFPPMTPRDIERALTYGTFTSNAELFFAKGIDRYDDHATMMRVIKSVGIVAVGAFVSALTPGATGFWAAVGASAVSGTADVLTAVGKVQDTKRDYAAGLRTDRDVKAAENYRNRAIVGSLADLATAGVTRARGTLSPGGEAFEGAVRALFDVDNQSDPMTMLFGMIAGGASGGLGRTHGGAAVGGVSTVSQRVERVATQAPPQEAPPAEAPR